MIKKFIRVMFVVGGIALTVLLLFAFYIWLVMFDVTGLVFYDDDPIKQVYSVNGKTFIVTDDNEVFVTGGAKTSTSRKYYNTLSVSHDIWGAQAPVKCFEGEVEAIRPACNDNSDDAYLITTSGILYYIKDARAKMIAKSVKKAYRNDDDTYILHNDLSLVKLNGKKETALIDGIIDFSVIGNHIFVIQENGDFRKLTVDADGNTVLSDIILQGAVSVSIAYSQNRIFNSNEDLTKLTIINVLLNDGTLYAKGTYNFVCTGFFSEKKIPPKVYEDWTIIGTKIKDYSISGTGTLAISTNGAVTYLGFNTNQRSNPIEFRQIEIAIDNVECIFSEEGYLLISDGNRLYVWGIQYSTPYLYTPEGGLDIFADEPKIIQIR